MSKKNKQSDKNNSIKIEISAFHLIDPFQRTKSRINFLRDFFTENFVLLTMFFNFDLIRVATKILRRLFDRRLIKKGRDLL